MLKRFQDVCFSGEASPTGSGGMGVLVFLLSILHITGSGSHMNLMKAESPGPSVNKLTPTVRSTAKTLYLIYLGMTIIEIIFLLVGGMPLLDTLTITFGFCRNRRIRDQKRQYGQLFRIPAGSSDHLHDPLWC